MDKESISEIELEQMKTYDTTEKKRGLSRFFSKKEKVPKIKRSISEIMPVIDMTENGLFELRTGEFMDILQIRPANMYAKNTEEQQFIIYNHAFFYQSCQYPIKIMSLHFPHETRKQQENLIRKMEQIHRPLYLRFLQEKLDALKKLEREGTNQEFFLFIYGESEKEVMERTESAKGRLYRSTPLSHVDEEKKLDILFKMFNQNARLGVLGC